MKPIFSFIIPSHNRADIICEALESIRLEQEGTGFSVEALVIDDGSQDDTQTVINQWCKQKHIHWLHYQRLETKAGAGVARNRGLDRAKGDILVFLDSDDQMLPGSLLHLKEHFENHADMGLYFGAILKKSGSLGQLPPATFQSRLLDFEQFAKLCGVGEYLPICRRSALHGNQGSAQADQLLRFREDINGFESILWMRMLHQGAKLWIDPRPVRLYDDLRLDRLCHPDNLAKDSERLASGFLLLFKEFGDELEDLQRPYWASLLLRLVFYNKLANNWNADLKAQFSKQITRAPIKVRLLAWLPGTAIQMLSPVLNRLRRSRLLNALG